MRVRERRTSERSLPITFHISLIFTYFTVQQWQARDRQFAQSPAKNFEKDLRNIQDDP